MSNPDYGLSNYVDSHPLFNKDAKVGAAFKGQLNPDRTKDTVREDLLAGHKAMGTDFEHLASMPPAKRLSAHRDAEFLGHTVRDRANDRNRSFGDRNGHFGA